MSDASKEQETFPRTHDALFIGFYLVGDVSRYWQVTCPCGITVNYPLNGIPEVDTPFPCKNKNHWVVKRKD